MDNQPAFDRSILVPIFISGFSLIGIVVVLLIGRALNAPAAVAVTPSATRFPYVYLGTEPAISTPVTEDTEIVATEPPFEEPTDFPVDTPFIPPTSFATSTRPGPLTPIVLTLPPATNTSPPTSTSASGPPLNPGTYDDIDSHLVYNGWNATNVAGAYQNTLHVSVVPGSTVSFRFIGRELRITFQGGSTLGRLTITVDNASQTVDQSVEPDQWAWPTLLSNGVHSVMITHLSGGSVNLDQVVIPEPVSTGTPTATPTRTPTP